MAELSYDQFSPEDIVGLGAYEQLCLLSELAGDVKAQAELKNKAIDAKRDAKMLCIDNPSKENKKFYEHASAAVQKAATLISARKLQIQSLQTIMRSQPQ